MELKVEESVFYQQCADILNSESLYCKFPFEKRTRWNNRKAGNGRFANFGLIRCYGDKVHINFRSPLRINRIFESKIEALNFLRGIKNDLLDV